MERWGIKDTIARTLRGEIVHVYDIKVPLKEMVEAYGDTKEVVTETLYQNIHSFPLKDEHGKLQYIVTIFEVARSYQGREEIIKGKEYIDNHWLEAFDVDGAARAANVSRYHFIRQFKKHTGITPYAYYQEVKIKKLKEALCNENRSVAQAFRDCGANYKGRYAELFKEKVGMTPSQYQRLMRKQLAL
jgi:transcriptional regulator GlxA family with amidase domain